MTERDFFKKKYIPKDQDDLLQDFHTDLSVGDILSRARLRTGLDMHQISAEIRIREEYLEAIEAGELEKLPGRIYALGFIRTYAEFLDLDGDKIIQLLKRQSGSKVEPKPLALTMQLEEEHSVPTVKTILIVLLALIAGLTTYRTLSGPVVDKEIIPSVPQELKDQVTLLTRPIKILEKKGSSIVKENLVSTTEDKGGSHPVVLKAVENVWLEIRTKDKQVILSRVLSAGEEYWVPADQPDLVMTLGNAGGLQIIVEGKTLPFLGRKGKVIRSLSLKPESLKEILKKWTKASM